MRTFLLDEQGQDLLEVTILLALFALSSVVVLHVPKPAAPGWRPADPQFASP